MTNLRQRIWERVDPQGVIRDIWFVPIPGLVLGALYLLGLWWVT